MLANEFHPGPRCSCADCLVKYPASGSVSKVIPLTEGPEGFKTAAFGSPSLIPELPDSFAIAMAKVEQLREANNERLARRDRAEWECFFHFACENSLLKRQAG